MRRLPAKLQDIINAGGPFFGDNAPITIVTVEPDWYLNLSSGPVGNRRADKLPIRWYQSALNDQTEVVVPNVKSVTIDRSLHEDAGTVQVVFYNTKTPTLGTTGDLPDRFGEPGYYSWARGQSPKAERRWGQVPNEWANILRENALLRVYQGYGPRGTSLARLLQSGNVILNGVFLVDNVALDAQAGVGTLNGRDMAKLLIEQYVWPPLVPQSFYTSAGVNYFVSGQSIGVDIDGNPLSSTDYGKGAYVKGRIAYSSSSSSYDAGMQAVAAAQAQLAIDEADGTSGQIAADQATLATAQTQAGASNLGHTPPNCVDGDPGTYWLSEGHAGPSGTPWIEFTVNETMTSLYLAPYEGNYLCYVSIFERGAWVSGEGSLNGVPYVTRFGVGAGGGRWYDLARPYGATKIRLTFSALFNSGAGYRAGLYEVQVGGNDRVTTSDKEILGIAVTGTGSGYRLGGTDGGVFDYGDASFLGSLAGKALDAAIVGIDNTWDAAGYWLAGADGGVFTFGDAGFYGSLHGTALAAPIVTLRATTNTPNSSTLGAGYWLVGADGGVYAFGDATFHGSATGTGGKNWDGTGCVDMAITPNSDGYILVSAAGDVRAFGAAQSFGNLSTRLTALGLTLNAGEYVVGIEYTATGNGYWMITNDGGVFTFGDAQFWGSLVGYSYPITTQTLATSNGNAVAMRLVLNAPITKLRRTASNFYNDSTIPTNGQGFYMVANDGGVFTFGDAQFWGSLLGAPILPGTYSDYADIIEDLCLWAGFWYYPGVGHSVPAHQKPSVFGNIETTGAFNSVGPLDPSSSDKVALIDFIKRLRDTVGYIFRVDETGGVRFESPNYWTAGNFFDDGTPIKYWPQLDEKLNMTGYIQTASDDPLRSEIIVSATDPYKFGGTPDGVYVTRFVPPYVGQLRGIVKPAMIGVPLNVPISPTDQEIMAELLALQIFFASRQGQVTSAVHPAICPNDQVQIWDRVTGEANIHYVVGVHTQHDLVAGTWTATYQTYWLGNEDNWSITTAKSSVDYQLGGTSQLTSTFYISDQLQKFLANTGGSSTAALAQTVLEALAPSPNPDPTGTTTQVVKITDPGLAGH